MTFAIQHISNSKQLNILSTKIESLVPLLALPVSAGEEILCGHFQLYVRKEFILCEFFVGVEFMIICVCVTFGLCFIAGIAAVVLIYFRAFKYASVNKEVGMTLRLGPFLLTIPSRAESRTSKSQDDRRQSDQLPAAVSSSSHYSNEKTPVVPIGPASNGDP